MADPPLPPASTPPPQNNAPIAPITGTPPAALAAAAAGNAVAVSALPTTTVPETDRLPKEGDEIITKTGKTYILGPMLGAGGFATVFHSQHNEIEIAVKTEKFSKSLLKTEIVVLKAAMKGNCEHFCELIDYGTKSNDFDYMMITLLGKNLHKLRCERPDRKFSINTALRIGIQTLKACEELHRIGFVSRDVKPGNFAPGLKANGQTRTIFMYDFGLARRYVDKNNQIKPARKEVGWRGTTRYGSLNAHKRKDLGRRDDLESWFYGLVEMTRGTLPWINIVERNHVQKAKVASRSAGRTQFLFETPSQYEKIFNLINSYSFESAPDYKQINKYLDEALRDREHWDWENETVSSTSPTITTITKISNTYNTYNTYNTVNTR